MSDTTTLDDERPAEPAPAGVPATDGADDEPVELEEDDYVYLPRESGALRKVLVVLVALALFAMALVGAGGLWLVNQVTGGDERGDSFTVTIPEGATMANASRILEEKGVVKNATFFRYYAKYKSIDKVKAGDYEGMRAGMSLDATIERLKKGPLPQKSTDLAIPEGLQLRDIHKKIINTFPDMTEQELGAAELGATSKYKSPDQLSLEGFLFPATYKVPKSDEGDEAKVISQMTQKFDEVADQVGLANAPTTLAGVAGKRQISPYEALIVASIIEREAKVPEDRPKIARVIYNRLARDMKLEIDATTLYCFPFKTDGKLTQSDLKVDCPYNTRAKNGLPPTPIASPGKASLEAALNPAPGNWLYYVLADKDGRHYFTDNFNEFQKVRAKSEKEGLL